MKQKWTIILVGLFLLKSICVFASDPDSLKDAKYIDRLVVYDYYYDFLKYEQNIIEWVDYTAIDDFFYKLKNTHKRKLTILHIGDSHVQADIYTGFLRDKLQEIFGYGGRGFVFPYRAAGTHSAYDYKTSAKGEWDKSRNVEREINFDLGLSGITIHTTDSSASFSIIFNKRYESIKDNFTVLKLFLKRSPYSYDIILKNSSDAETYEIDSYEGVGSHSYIRVDLQNAPDTLEFIVHKTDSLQRFFEFYGLIIESKEDKGILYNSVGINGAAYRSILQQSLFGPQLELLKPDLLVLDLGANDFYRGAYNYDVMRNNLERILQIIKQSSPSTEILITNSQDIYSRRRNISNCVDFSKMTREVAFENGCAFYDYYVVSGGQYAMLKWLSYNLAQRDRVHLTTSGYTTKAQLMCNAFLNTYARLLDYSNRDSLIALIEPLDTSNFINRLVDKESIKRKTTAIAHVTNNSSNNDYYDQYATSGNKLYYTIESGDNLGYIAEKFKVSVADLKRWNGIIGTKIIAGENLVIYTKEKNTSNTSTNQTQTINPIPGSGSKITYTIQSGDVLGSIAARYNVSVSDLKRWNGLGSDNIRAGDKLVIYSGEKKVVSSQKPTTRTNQAKTTSSNGISKYSGLKTTVHVVKSGDTLWDIAQRYGVSVDNIKKINKLSSDKLDVGQRIIIK
jgi:LysM repeat protein/lysophospholipase L1-like esterase